MRTLLGLFLLLFAASVSAAATGVTARSILLGQSAAFSGPAAQLGIHLNIGTKAYFDHVNAQGGVYGRKIELKTLDDRYEANLCIENTKKLIQEDKVFALVAYVGTPTTVAAMPIFTQAQVPLIGPFTGAESLRSPVNRYIFNLRASYYDETEQIVEQLVSTGNHKIAVFYQDDAYGQAGLKGVQIAMDKRGMKIAALGKVERNTVKVQDAVRTINAAQPDGVIMISAYTSIAEFVREMKAAGSTTQFYNVSFVGSTALADALKDAGYGVAISQVVPFPWSPSAPIVKEYQEVMTKQGHTDFDFTSLEGYIVGKTVVEGLRRAGKDLTREKLVAALESMSNVDLGDFVVSFSPVSHSGSKFVDLTMIGRAGKFIK
ncbi:MAG TPA: ABC transporter substrate-binding protein [Burkholderiales bacterium]|nr:ABC transporter substrate-binding protein [Burkholderiales bacterium]